jgi:hypothetical protein
MTPNEIHPHIRPFKVAIKALLRAHLPPLLRAMRGVAQRKDGVVVPEAVAAKAGKVLGVIMATKSPFQHDKIVNHVLGNADAYTRVGCGKDVAAMRAANSLHSKMQSVEAWLANHPNPKRVPMMNGNSEAAPLPEDLELNELLQEAKTLGMVYDRDFVLLFRKED